MLVAVNDQFWRTQFSLENTDREHCWEQKYKPSHSQARPAKSKGKAEKEGNAEAYATSYPQIVSGDL